MADNDNIRSMSLGDCNLITRTSLSVYSLVYVTVERVGDTYMRSCFNIYL